MQGSKPNWQPLVDLIGERLTGDFMWMFEVELETGVSIHAYKHCDTRRYIHLAADGSAFYYQEPDRYVSTPAADQLELVFAILPGLGGVTEGQILDSHRAIERLRGGDPDRDTQSSWR